MKLSSLSESFMLAKIRDALMSSGQFNRPFSNVDRPYDASSGHDGNDRTVAKQSSVPKQRNKRYLGMEKRLGTIRL